MTTVSLIIWRTLIVGSRILVFVLFASFFHYWLFVVVGFHYLLMFALVFYQMWLRKEKLIARVMYNIVTPFIYVFDYCMNLLAGPTFYWYLICYVPMYCENLLMTGLVLWHASTTSSPAWYIVLGCVSVIVMFPLGVLAQLAYFNFWHPNVISRKHPQSKDRELPHLRTWPEFLDAIKKTNQPKVNEENEDDKDLHKNISSRANC